MNEFKDDTEPKKALKKAKKSFVNAYVKPLLDGSFLSKESSAKELPFMAFLLFLIILFISNTFWAQSTVRKIEKYKEEVKELRIKSISVKAKLMDNTRQTNIADKVAKLGLKESLKPPKKIYVKKEDK
ncbi:MAG: hypothetical protein DRI74_02740 [Bacteroidetes bacterium]|nr:MAG: hypothetical protein DRI74_02740 [Bacteroidota bacterium]